MATIGRSASLAAVGVAAFALVLAPALAHDVPPVPTEVTGGPLAPPGEPLSLSGTTLPFLFEVNRGQADKRARFVVRRPGYNVFLTPTGLVTVLAGIPEAAPDGADARPTEPPAPSEPPPAMALHMQFVGASERAVIAPVGKAVTTANLFLGNAAAGWQRDVPLHATVRYANVYRGTDLYVNSHRGRLAYHWVLRQGRGAGRIRMRFTGARAVSLDADGRLVVELPNGGRIVHHGPRVSEHLNGRERLLPGRFRMLSGDTVGFVIGRPQQGATGVIDPEIDFGTYFGGTGGEAIRHGFHATNAFKLPRLDLDRDAEGRLLIGGTTMSADLPAAAGAIPPPGSNAFAARLDADDPAGARFDFVTYVGGSFNDDAFGIVAGGQGQT